MATKYLWKQHDVDWWRTHIWCGAHLYRENRMRVPLEVLEKYNHQMVVWFPDGSGIRDADSDADALRARLLAEGEDTSMFVFEEIDLDDVGHI